MLSATAAPVGAATVSGAHFELSWGKPLFSCDVLGSGYNERDQGTARVSNVGGGDRKLS